MLKKSLSIQEAMAISIGESNRSVWTNYQLGSLLFILYHNKKHQNFPLKVRKKIPNISDFNRVISELIQNNIIEYDDGKFYKVVARKKEFDIKETMIIIDPFCYLSHLSAMNYYNLTEIISDNTIISSKTLKDWRTEALSLMKNNLGELYESYRLSGLPLLANINISNTIDSKIIIYRNSDLGDYVSAKYEKIRVANIGRTFLDMLRRSDLCGGINNVINVFHNKAKLYINPIINEIDRFGSKIEKVRAGYILENYCNITDELISGWERFAMRGGSRKLDPLAEYSNNYSERWKISINIS